MRTYKKGDFFHVPNKSILSGKPAELQCLYFWIISYSNEDGTCFPSRSTLAKNTGTNIKTVDKYLKELEVLGLIRKEVRTNNLGGQTSNMYYTDFVDETYTPSTENGVPPAPKTVWGGSTENGSRTHSNILTQYNEDIFTLWNSKEIIIHQRINDDIKKEIKHALKNYTFEEITKAIEVYAVVISDSTKYWWSHKWGLALFLKRGLTRFVGSEPKNYQKEKSEQGMTLDLRTKQ